MTETVSGNCPSCGYNKMISRFGDGVMNIVEGCARCGLGYSSLSEEGSEPNENTWRDYMIHILSNVDAPEMNSELRHKLDSQGIDVINDDEYIKYNEEFYKFINNRKVELSKLDNMALRIELMSFLSKIDRTDEVTSSIFMYSDNEIANHKSKMKIIQDKC